VNRSELIETLEDAGLSPYQADAYVTILEFGAAPVTDVADASGVPDPRIYDVLRDLEREGYIELYERESLHAQADSLEEVTHDLQSRASRFTEAAGEIERRWEEPAMDESSISIVTQFETVLKNAAEWIREADTQVQVSLGADQYERLRPALAEATANGVEVHLSVYAPDADAVADAEADAAACTELRRREIPSPFVAIADRTRSCFAPHEGSVNEYGVLVDDRTHTYVFHWFFLTTQWDVWETGETSEAVPEAAYADVRYFVRDVAPLLEEGLAVRVRVEGIDLGTGETAALEGVVDDLLLSQAFSEGDVPENVASYGGQVGLIVGTDDGPVEVGGWGAMVEEFEAHRITVLAVEE